jgi:serine/threonine-protein kinase
MSSDPRIGTTIGEYRIESILGRGGMSVVYLAEHERLKRKAALKVLSTELAEDPAFRQRFVSEWERLAALDHPNIIPIFEAGEVGGQLYIAMRYVDTTDLKGLLRSEGRLEPARAVAIVTQVASALDAAHARSLVHRDVKPANVLIALGAGFEGIDHAYLSDFGLTKSTDSRSGLTKTGTFMGTVDYVAPEQIAGKDVDGRADQYALACVLFECLTGRIPFPRQEDTAAMFAHLQEPPPRVTEANPTLPAAIDDVIARGMAKEPDERYATCMELARTARAALGLGQTSPVGVPMAEGATLSSSSPTLPPTPSKVVPPPGALAPPAPPGGGGRSKTPVMVGAAIATVVVAAIAFVALGGGDEEEPAASGSVTAPTGPTATGPTASGPTAITGETGAAVSGPSGAVIFSDSFEDPSVGWEDSPQNGVQRELTPEGTYRFTWTDQSPVDAFATAFGGVGGIGPGGLDATDVRVSVTATLVTAEGRHTFGVACRANEDTTYYAYISSDGFWQIAKIFNVGEFASLNQGSDDSIAKGEDTYEIAATCIGDEDGLPVTVALFVDGKEIATAVDDTDPITSGSAGIFAEGNTGTVIEFDDFQVTDTSA